MNEDRDPERDQLKPIPEEFYSFSSGKPFIECISCNKELIQSGEPYVIEKAIRKYKGYKAQDVIFEYAMCMQCAIKMQQEMSEESMQKITQFFSNNLDFEKLNQRRFGAEVDSQRAIQHCLITGDDRNDIEEYQIYAQCKGTNLISGTTPYMVSGAALEEVSELLSEKTKDELDGFIDDHFGIPPDLRKNIRSRDLIWI